MEKVYIYKCKDYDNIDKPMQNIIDCFDRLKNIKAGTKVVIKANLVSAMNPEKGATTNPVLLAYLTNYLKEKGCKVTIGDSPGGIYTKAFLNHVYNVTKMKDTGAELNNNFTVKKTINTNATVLKSFEYTAYLDEADLLINFCKLKTHGMMGMSCSVKNLFGVIPGTLKPEYHYRFPNIVDFANILIDLNEYFKPQINIVDAVVGMEGNGPTMGDARQIGCILASNNQYALDYICAQVIGIKPESVETIKQSINRNLFEKNKIELNDELSKFIINDFKKINKIGVLDFFGGKKDWFSKTLAFFSTRIFSNKPKLKKKKCVGCGKCANICPAKAITIYNKKAIIDRSKCIKCYCCQEFCPIGAMVVKSSLICRILHLGKKK